MESHDLNCKVAPTYELVNHVLTLWLDVTWRKRHPNFHQ